MKKRLTLFGVFVALAALSLVGVAAVSAGGFGGSSEQLDRVAELLGVSPEELSTAVDQARSEARAERLEERLTAGVADGVITAEEADAIRDWFNGKPDALSNLSHSDRHGLKHAQQEGALAEFLAGLVTEEILTDAESDEIASWIGDRPDEALEQLRSEYGRGGHHGRFGRGGFGGFGGQRGHGGFRGFNAPVPEAPATDTSTSVVYY